MDNNTIQSIILPHSKPANEIMHGFVVLVGGRIFTTPSGKFLFETRQQANQSFYNTLSHIAVTRYMAQDESLRRMSSRQIYDMFKRDVGFTIRQV